MKLLGKSIGLLWKTFQIKPFNFYILSLLLPQLSVNTNKQKKNLQKNLSISVK